MMRVNHDMGIYHHPMPTLNAKNTKQQKINQYKSIHNGLAQTPEPRTGWTNMLFV